MKPFLTLFWTVKIPLLRQTETIKGNSNWRGVIQGTGYRYWKDEKVRRENESNQEMSNCRRYQPRGLWEQTKRHVSRGQEFGGWALWNMEEVGRSMSPGLKPLRKWHQTPGTRTSTERSPASQVSVSTEEYRRRILKLLRRHSGHGWGNARGTPLPRMHLQQQARLERGSSTSVGVEITKRSWGWSQSCCHLLKGQRN